MKNLGLSLSKLVSILNDGQYHDGTRIGDKLHITRAAVWKAIKKLGNYGIIIDSIKGKGYAMLEPLILLNKQIIKKNLTNKNIDIDLFETIDSTNDYLKTYFHSRNPRICLAEHQTSGKGRLNREWFSPFGQNIYLSCLYPFEKDVSELAGLSLATSLAVMKTLTTYHLPQPFFVKWPNDVIYAKKKISGNIIEIQAETNGICHAIIGIGINVNMLHDEDHAITQAWTSLRDIVGEYIDRNHLCALLINNLMSYLKRFEEHGLSDFMEEWKMADYLQAQEIKLDNIHRKVSGQVQGIDQHGHLLLKLKDGTVQAFSSGDTSIIKGS